MIVVLVACLVSNAPADLIYRFEFEGNADDSSGNGYNGTEVGAGVAYTAPGIGAAVPDNGFYAFTELTGHGDALSLSAIDESYIDVPVTGWNGLGPEITVSFYARQTVFGGQSVWQARDYEDRGAFEGDPDPTLREERGCSLSTWMDGMYFDVGASRPVRVWTTGSVEDAWHHYAFTHDVIGNVQNAYRDGVLMMTDDASAFPYTGADEMYIGHLVTYWGGDETVNPSYYNGLIDDLRIYDEILDIGTIQDLAGDIIPEPATMILLGLGGLGLLRKKK